MDDIGAKSRIRPNEVTADQCWEKKQADHERQQEDCVGIVIGPPEKLFQSLFTSATIVFKSSWLNSGCTGREMTSFAKRSATGRLTFPAISRM